MLQPIFMRFYGEYEITIEIESGNVNGEFPKRTLAHVQEWRELHKAELLADWGLAQKREPLNKIPPLE